VSRFRSLLTSDEQEDSLALFEQGKIPKLRALQLHNGTVYKWNRVCYGVGGGKPHLRIECRYIPAGPTLKDEIANMVFWVGLMLGQTEDYKNMPDKMNFKDVKANFYKAARYGMEIEFNWMGKMRSATTLLLEDLLPMARQGLQTAHIDSADIDMYLGIIERRVKTRIGAKWLVDNFRNLQNKYSPFEARQELTAFMHAQQLTNHTVDTWANLNIDLPNGRSKTIVKHKMKTKLFVVDQSDSLELVSYIMKWNKIHHLPVINKKKELVGLMSWTDVMALDSFELSSKIKDVMQTNLVTIGQEKSIERAKKLMQTHKINCLPVVSGRRLLGILTSKDF
jgi:CBS domain-containing protein